MATFLVGIMYHEPEGWALRQGGIVEDFESSTGVFIDAETADAALAWAEQIGVALLRKLNADDTLDWKALGYFCWIEADPRNCMWSHCLSFFRSVSVGEWPDLNEMGTEAYRRWAAENGIIYRFKA